MRQTKRVRLERKGWKIGSTQVEMAKMISSSQSRVAKMESGDPSVSIDLLVKALLALGATRRQTAGAMVASRAAQQVAEEVHLTG